VVDSVYQAAYTVCSIFAYLFRQVLSYDGAVFILPPISSPLSTTVHSAIHLGQLSIYEPI